MSNSSNKSLYLYTALIFLVAIIMIIISFFGQSNVEKNQPIQAESVTSIEEKTSQLSEDNRILLSQNESLQETNKLLTEQVATMQAKIDEMTAEASVNDALIEISAKIYEGSKKTARGLLEAIDETTLTGTQKAFYDILVRKAK